MWWKNLKSSNKIKFEFLFEKIELVWHLSCNIMSKTKHGDIISICKYLNAILAKVKEVKAIVQEYTKNSIHKICLIVSVFTNHVLN